MVKLLFSTLATRDACQRDYNLAAPLCYIQYHMMMYLSLSTVVGIGQKLYGFQKFCALKINFAINS